MCWLKMVTLRYSADHQIPLILFLVHVAIAWSSVVNLIKNVFQAEAANLQDTTFLNAVVKV